MIHAHAKEGEFEWADSFFSRMIEENVLPNEITYNALVNGLCRNGKAKLAYEYFHQMQEKRLSPNKYTYTLLINANCNLGNWNEALRLYGEMHEKGIQPDSCTQSLLFKQFGEDFKCYAVRDRQTKGSSAVQKDQWNLWLRKISGWLVEGQQAFFLQFSFA
nr:pentatricopeptide repeat protein AaPPR991 [Agave angustifolia]